MTKTSMPEAITDKQVIAKLRKVRLSPSIKLWAWCAGGTFIYVEITWTTHLVDGSLMVLVDNNTDITSQFTIDNHAMKAVATVEIGAVGIHVIDTHGEFLSRFIPIGAIRLSASSGVYIPY